MKPWKGASMTLYNLQELIARLKDLENEGYETVTIEELKDLLAEIAEKDGGEDDE